MFRLRAIGFIVTHFLLALAGAMLIPTLVSLLTDSADVPEFLLSALAIAGAAMVMRQATRSVMLMDSGKFGRKSLIRVCHVNEVDQIVTDSGIDSAWRERLGDQLLVAG